MEMCLAFEYESLSVPAPLPARIPGYLDTAWPAAWASACLSAWCRAIKGPCLPSHPRFCASLSVADTQWPRTSCSCLARPLRRSPSACLGRHSQSGVGARRYGLGKRDEKAAKGTEREHPESRASVHDTSEAVLTVALSNPLCVRPSQ